LRAGVLEQITKDHSLLQEQMDAGLITIEQAATSSIKNLVTRALGVDDTVLLEVNEHVVQAGDLYLMCSDGLSDMIDDVAIGNVVSSELELDQKAKQLIDLANENGGRDNISVLMVELHEAPEKRGLIARLLGK
jgi:protein phosphatase